MEGCSSTASKLGTDDCATAWLDGTPSLLNPVPHQAHTHNSRLTGVCKGLYREQKPSTWQVEIGKNLQTGMHSCHRVNMVLYCLCRPAKVVSSLHCIADSVGACCSTQPSTTVHQWHPAQPYPGLCCFCTRPDSAFSAAGPLGTAPAPTLACPARPTAHQQSYPRA